MSKNKHKNKMLANANGGGCFSQYLNKNTHIAKKPPKPKVQAKTLSFTLGGGDF